MALWPLPQGGGGSGGCAHGGNMSSRPSAWPCPQPPTTASTRWRLARSTTPYGDRRRTGPAERWRSACCTTRRGARSLLHRGRGQHHWSRCGRRWGTSGTVAAASSSFSTSQCRSWVVNWWKCRTSCLRLSSRTFTFQFVVVGVPKFLVEEFKVSAQDRVQHFSSSHPRRQCLIRLRQWWSTSHMRRQCFQRQRQ